MEPRTVHLVVPADIDDAAVASGGNVYDRRVGAALPAAGWTVRELAVAGAWPHPDPPASASLAHALADLLPGAVVLLDGLVGCAVPEVVSAAARGVRVAVLVHLPLGDEAGAPPARAAALAALERDALHAAHAVVATSRWTADRLIAHHGLERVEVAAPGVDPAPLAPGTDGATGLLGVGALTPTKGHDVLVEALATLADRRWRCDLVGSLARDPDHVTGIHDAITRHRLAGRVRVLGPRTGDALEEAYAAADLLVLPSRVEGYGMVVTEALARGIPVLATAVGGVPEALGREPGGEVPGLLVPRVDAASVAAALCAWLDDPDMRARLRDRARRRRGALTGWDTTATRIAAVLEGLR